MAPLASGPVMGVSDDLALEYSKEPPGLVAWFAPRAEHEGPPGHVHGGVVATCLDETMAALGWVLDDETPCVTGILEVKYRRPVPLDAGRVRIEAWRDRLEPRRRQRVQGRLLLPDGAVAAEASGIFLQAPRSSGPEP